jgi:hypothetical protein
MTSESIPQSGKLSELIGKIFTYSCRFHVVRYAFSYAGNEDRVLLEILPPKVYSYLSEEFRAFYHFTVKCTVNFVFSDAVKQCLAQEFILTRITKRCIEAARTSCLLPLTNSKQQQTKKHQNKLENHEDLFCPYHLLHQLFLTFGHEPGLYH